MNIIENYERARQDLYNHVGFVEDWVVYPIEINTNMYWTINGNDEVLYAVNREDVEDETGEHCVDDIYKQRFYKKHVYEGDRFTMIFCNPHVDGMIWFRVFDNTKKVY